LEKIANFKLERRRYKAEDELRIKLEEEREEQEKMREIAKQARVKEEEELKKKLEEIVKYAHKKTAGKQDQDSPRRTKTPKRSESPS